MRRIKPMSSHYIESLSIYTPEIKNCILKMDNDVFEIDVGQAYISGLLTMDGFREAGIKLSMMDDKDYLEYIFNLF